MNSGEYLFSVQQIDEHTLEENKPSKKKPSIPISAALRQYLKQHGRELKLPCMYEDLARFSYASPLLDRHGNNTFWESVSYDLKEWEFIRSGLIQMYGILKTEGNDDSIKHLDVARIDYCSFGNSNPFRIRLINRLNDNYDHFYIKKGDASRVYGLELEHILSPNRLNYYTYYNTLVEDHIPGIPGDVFIRDYLHKPDTNVVRLAKEFVKFNERCFIRLLGDMRSYNFIVNIIPDIEDVQYRIRAIDFDQQSYEGKRLVYLPQFFKENFPLVDISLKKLGKDSIHQYQIEERTQMALRLTASRYRVMALLDIMAKDTISTAAKTQQLKGELQAFFNGTKFYDHAFTMGELVKQNLKQTMRSNLQRIPQGRFSDE